MPTSNVDTQNSTLLLSTSDWLLQLKLLMPTSDSEPTGFTIANIKLCSYRRETVGPTTVLTFSEKITAGPGRTIALLKTPGSTTIPCWFHSGPKRLSSAIFSQSRKNVFSKCKCLKSDIQLYCLIIGTPTKFSVSRRLVEHCTGVVVK